MTSPLLDRLRVLRAVLARPHRPSPAWLADLETAARGVEELIEDEHARRSLTYARIVESLRLADSLGDCVPEDIEGTARAIVDLRNQRLKP